MNSSPLSLDDIQKIEGTQKLSALERHHLRILAHCLESFREITGGKIKGSIPEENEILEWCRNNETLREQKSFIPILLKQLSSASSQLQAIAKVLGKTPLEINLDDLIKVSLNSASAK